MNIEDMRDSAAGAAEFLRSFANETRLMLVCQLVDGEKNVSELSEALDARQSTISQQLALLRREGIVAARKEAQAVYYSLADENAQKLVGLLYDMFCAAPPAAQKRKSARRKAMA